MKINIEKKKSGTRFFLLAQHEFEGGLAIRPRHRRQEVEQRLHLVVHELGEDHEERLRHAERLGAGQL